MFFITERKKVKELYTRGTMNNMIILMTEKGEKNERKMMRADERKETNPSTPFLNRGL